MTIEIFINFAIAIALGGLIGIDRERDKTKKKFSPAGIRTFSFITFLGALSAFLYQEFHSIVISSIILISLSVIIAISYFYTAKKGFLGITTEITALIAFFVGFLCMFSEYRIYAIVFGVLVTVILSMRKSLHDFAKKTKEIEWRDSLRFAFIAFVVLPILPKEVHLSFIPDGRFDSLNTVFLRELWLLVVFVSGISFLGYFLVKFIGQKRGVILTGAFGGIVSSTAVTSSMASYSKEIKNKNINVSPFVLASIIATCISFIRTVVITVSINQDLKKIVIPIFFMIITGILLAINLWSKSGTYKTKVKLDTPFAIKPALTLAFFYFIVTTLNKLAIIFNIPKIGVLLTALLGGFADVDPILLSVSTLSSEGKIDASLAIVAILISVIANLMGKSFISFMSGSRSFSRGIVLRYALLALIGTISIIIVLI